MLIKIIDLGINNLTSVAKAFSEHAKKSVIEFVDTKNSKKDTSKSNLIVLPGLGNFGAAARILENSDLPEYIHNQISEGASIVGICLGMQLLGDKSDESPGSKGLGLIPGTSRLLPAASGERIPNVGWMKVNANPLYNWQSMSSGADFYFTHSFTLHPLSALNKLASSPYGDTEIVSAVIKNRVMGFQFHPEKSGKAGKRLIKEVLEKVK